MTTATKTRVPSPDAVQQSHSLPAVQSDAPALIQIIERAVRDPSVDIDKLQRLLDMRERVQAKESETSFDIGMTEAQRETRAVVADSTNVQTRNMKYASYYALDAALRPIYTDKGFALSFNTEDGAPDNCVRVVCRVSHNGGHSRMYRLDMPADGKGAKGGDVMTKTHATGSAVSYGMRYLLKMIFNIAVDSDDDGNAAGASTSRQPTSRVPSPNEVPPAHAEPHAFSARSPAEWATKFLGYIAATKTAAEVVAWDAINRDNLTQLAKADPVRCKTVMAAMKARKAEYEAGEPVTADGELPAKAKADPNAMPSPADNPEAARKYVVAKLATFGDGDYDRAAAWWQATVADHEDAWLPPDFQDLQSLWRKVESRLAP